MPPRLRCPCCSPMWTRRETAIAHVDAHDRTSRRGLPCFRHAFPPTRWGIQRLCVFLSVLFYLEKNSYSIPRKNAAFLFDTETQILSYLSSSQVFPSHLTLLLVLRVSVVSCPSGAINVNMPFESKGKRGTWSSLVTVRPPDCYRTGGSPP